jgi:biotin-[acetyl-CoA-carboxylase] ligase BirA-like protein
MIKQIHLNECDSTQDELKEQLSNHDLGVKFLISCDHQLKGRGRAQNEWISMPGTLCFSFNIVPHPILSFTAIEMSTLLVRFFEGSILQLKWPNDILNKNNKKCAGILVQSYQGMMLVGIGVNLFSNLDSWGGIYESSFDFDKKSWALEITHFIHENRYQDELLLKKHWEMKCAHMNSFISISEGKEKFQGLFLGLGEHGQALVKSENQVKHVYNGTLRIED